MADFRIPLCNHAKLRWYFSRFIEKLPLAIAKKHQGSAKPSILNNIILTVSLRDFLSASSGKPTAGGGGSLSSTPISATLAALGDPGAGTGAFSEGRSNFCVSKLRNRKLTKF